MNEPGNTRPGAILDHFFAERSQRRIVVNTQQSAFVARMDAKTRHALSRNAGPLAPRRGNPGLYAKTGSHVLAFHPGYGSHARHGRRSALAKNAAERTEARSFSAGLSGTEELPDIRRVPSRWDCNGPLAQELSKNGK